MKNIIFIDVDTERSKPIVFGKPSDFEPPQNAEDAAKMILTDIVCVSEALTTLIVMASVNNYANVNELVDNATKTIKQAIQEFENNMTVKNSNDNEHQNEDKGSPSEETK